MLSAKVSKCNIDNYLIQELYFTMETFLIVLMIIVWLLMCYFLYGFFRDIDKPGGVLDMTGKALEKGIDKIDEGIKNRKRKKDAWNNLSMGMSKEQVISKFGKPHAAMQFGEEESWSFGSKEKDGKIYFCDDKVVGFKKPD